MIPLVHADYQVPRCLSPTNTPSPTPAHTLHSLLRGSSSCCSLIPNLLSGSRIETYHFNHALASQEANLHYKSQIPFPSGGHAKDLASFSLCPEWNSWASRGPSWAESFKRIKVLNGVARQPLTSLFPTFWGMAEERESELSLRGPLIQNFKSISDDGRAID